MIRSFADRETELIWHGLAHRSWPPTLAKRALQKLRLIDAATSLEDLRIPPGNRLEALKGDRKGSHSIRINDQWRVCFRWSDGAAHDVEIADYH